MTNVFIISAPSGSGKSTLVRWLLQRDPKLMFSVSYTTRQPRGAEMPGESYHFITREAFEERIAEASSSSGPRFSATTTAPTAACSTAPKAEGQDLVLDIDVQGARQLKEAIPDAVSIFILAPSREILEQRLRSRSEDAEAVIQKRLRKAADEIRNYTSYDYVLVNDDLARSTETLAAIVAAERVRRIRVEPVVRSILASFE